jgi:nanoRNase/pAp phosphatase (c-di-AMP/oligoRNAs hydrolase)
VGREALVVAHKNADPDAVGAAVGVKNLLNIYGVEAQLVFPEGPSRESKLLMESLGIREDYYTSLEECATETLIIVDTASPVQLGDHRRCFGEFTDLIVVDHHKGNILGSKATVPIIVSDAASTSEIEAFIARLLRVHLSRPIAGMLLAGILRDSRWLRITGPFTVEAVGYLLDLGASTSEISRILQDTPMRDVSERIALLKAASRLKIARICGEILLAVTHIGSFEASVARALLTLGADVAVVAKNTREGVRISVRTSPRAESNGITALAVSKYIAEKFGGEGGGHVSAAGVELLTQKYTAEMIVEELARSLPGKLARMCVEARRAGNE